MRWMLLGAALAGCTPEEDTAAPASALTALATQNVGTTTWLDLVAGSPSEDVRQVCSDWYDNNLCLGETETLVAEAIAQDTLGLIFLQEVWEQARCEGEERSEEVNGEPYACAQGEDPQPERLLGDDWQWGCAEGYPDNCVAVHRELAELGGCDGRDCSALVLSNPAACGADGRIASIEIETEAGALVAVVVHANAGVEEDDVACRAEQLASIQAVLEAYPSDTSIAMAGDFNLDPDYYEGADAVAFEALRQALGLSWLPSDGETHRISHVRLDHVLVRGTAVASDLACEVRFLDEGRENVMLDHGWVACR